MNIAICDDEQTARINLYRYLDDYFRSKRIEPSITFFNNGEALCKSDKSFEIIFMDYKMDDLDGIETARKLRDREHKSTIIYVSAYPDAAFDAFEVNAYRFLTKPIDKDKLFKVLDDYQREIEDEYFVIFKTHESTIRLRVSDIYYAEARRNHTIIHTCNGDIEVLVNLKKVDQKLEKFDFNRSHHAYLVSLHHISSHNSSDILFEDGSRAYISRNYLRQFKTEFQKYILKHNTEKA